jgi:hypothetical protein
MGNIDLSQISNMLSGIDLNNSNLSEMINSLSNNNSFESNDVQYKHTDLKERTHSILKNLEEEDMGQLIYILAHLVDERKLEALNRIIEESSN